MGAAFPAPAPVRSAVSAVSPWARLQPSGEQPVPKGAASDGASMGYLRRLGAHKRVGRRLPGHTAPPCKIRHIYTLDAPHIYRGAQIHYCKFEGVSFDP